MVTLALDTRIAGNIKKILHFNPQQTNQMWLMLRNVCLLHSFMFFFKLFDLYECYFSCPLMQSNLAVTILIGQQQDYHNFEI